MENVGDPHAAAGPKVFSWIFASEDMKVTFVRHAESVFNKYLTSGKDCDLTAVGRDQAAKLEGKYDVIVLSCLRRTHQTLLYSQLKASRILITDLCREKRVDICDFLLHENEANKESDEELAHRIDCFKEFLRREVRPEETCAVITHGDFIHAATGRVNYPANAETREWTL